MALQIQRRPTLCCCIILLVLLLAVAAEFSRASREIIQKQEQQQQVYIVHVDPEKKPAPYKHLSHWYDALSPKIIYKYSSVLSGFAARLTESELRRLRSTETTLNIWPQEAHRLHTTRTPEFLDLPANTVGPSGGAGVIIGVIDTGIYSGSRSFGDAGMPPPPARWKGGCNSSDTGVSCNNKLIGAKFFGSASLTAEQLANASARDDNGHGTHCASIAAGSEVRNASVMGYAPGRARGIADKSWVAAYKVCWEEIGHGVCNDADILAGIEAAIKDGVDVISISLGSLTAKPYYAHLPSIAALAATKQGIFVACSAGNNGPSTSTVTNVAPWVTTVAAGSIDRDFPASVTLGTGYTYPAKSFAGASLTTPTPLVYFPTPEAARLCEALDPELVAGKIVACDIQNKSEDRVLKGATVKAAGGVGMVQTNVAALGEWTSSGFHVLPAVHVGALAAQDVRHYALSTAWPVAVLDCSRTAVGTLHAPEAADFSSRGPNRVTPGILKPDVMAPGVKIVGAWPASVPPSEKEWDTRSTAFMIQSGTSMACPHVAGIAAVLRASHPEWSPAAVRSALMTTADVTGHDGLPIKDQGSDNGAGESTPEVHGAGHVNPIKAMDPGLVYDLTYTNYTYFVCALGYTDEQVQALIPNFTCTRKLTSVGNLNYPSFLASFSENELTVTYYRTLTNVGSGAATYKVSGLIPSGVSAVVHPGRLEFSKTGESIEYTVKFQVSELDTALNSKFGHLTWSDGKHSVRSPLAFRVDVSGINTVGSAEL